jgi:hypothetical protein
MKTRVLVLSLSLLLFIGSFFTVDTNAASSLAITVTTDKPFYRLLSTAPSQIGVGGNLTLNGAPVSGGLIAVTVFQGKIGHYVRPVLFRTLATGSLPSQNWGINVSLGVLGLEGVQYVPQTVFTRPSNQTDPGPAFNVTYKNTGSSTLMELYITLTILDATNVPITTINVTRSTQPIQPGAFASIILPPTPLQNWVALGNATAYVSAFSNLPPNQYFPLCPETSKQFAVVTKTPTEKISPSVKGNYSMAFNLSYVQALPFIAWGNYTVEVAATYQGMQAINSYTFWARIPGDVNGDGKVNIFDLMLIAFNWGKTIPPAPAYLDLDGHHKVDVGDLMYVAFYWGRTEQKLP